MFIFNEEKVLPFSADRYKLNIYGEILNSNNDVIKTELINNRIFVELDWVNGRIKYEIAVIIAIIIYEIKIPTNLWDKIEAIFEDKDSTNINITNISYRFIDGPVEVKESPGFFYVPYYTGYAISLNGDLLKLNRNRLNSWSVTSYQEKKNIKGGYRIARTIKDFGCGRSLSRHRAIGLVFIKYETNPLSLVINHLDGIPGNDSPKNLEWTTKAKNNQHAYDTGLFTNKTIKVLMKNTSTGEISKFNSLSECGKAIGRSESFVNVRLTKKMNFRYYDNLVFKLDDESSWPILDDKIKSESGYYYIVARNVFSGEQFVYPGINEASSAMKISQTSICRHIAKNKRVALLGFNFRHLEKDIDWPVHTKEELAMFREHRYFNGKGIGVLVSDLNGKIIEFYTTIEKAAKAHDVGSWKFEKNYIIGKPIEGKIYSLYKVKE